LSQHCFYLFLLGEAFSEIKSQTFKNLRERVRLYQNALKSLNVSKGDCVGG